MPTLLSLVASTTKDGWIHLNVVEIRLTSTIHFDGQIASSPINPFSLLSHFPLNLLLQCLFWSSFDGYPQTHISDLLSRHGHPPSNIHVISNAHCLPLTLSLSLCCTPQRSLCPLKASQERIRLKAVWMTGEYWKTLEIAIAERERGKLREWLGIHSR